MKLGIVVLNFNDYVSTIEQIKRVQACEAVDHLVVVDNCSTNESFNELEKVHDGTWDLIRTDHNGGYAYGNNRGIDFLMNQYKVDIIGIANPDVYFENHFIEAIKEDFRTYPQYTIIAGVETDENGKISTGSFWRDNAWLLLQQCKYTEVVPFIWKRLKRKIGKEPDYVKIMLQRNLSIFSVDNVVGSLFFVRSNEFMRVGGFDENTFLYMEEDILSQKIRKNGGKLAIDPELGFIHLGSVSINKSMSWKEKRKIQDQSDIYFFKSYITNNWIWFLFFRLHLMWIWGRLYWRNR